MKKIDEETRKAREIFDTANKERTQLAHDMLK